MRRMDKGLLHNSNFNLLWPSKVPNRLIRHVSTAMKQVITWQEHRFQSGFSIELTNFKVFLIFFLTKDINIFKYAYECYSIFVLLFEYIFIDLI